MTMHMTITLSKGDLSATLCLSLCNFEDELSEAVICTAALAH